MPFGAHVILYSTDADADRGFLREMLGTRAVDAGGGWLIMALPPAEVAVHPAGSPGAELYLLCDDIEAEVAALQAKGVEVAPVEDQRWGIVTKLRLPSGAEVGLYQPRHELALARDEPPPEQGLVDAP